MSDPRTLGFDSLEDALTEWRHALATSPGRAALAALVAQHPDDAQAVLIAKHLEAGAVDTELAALCLERPAWFGDVFAASRITDEILSP